MPFIDEILRYKSVSIVGMEKNTGKTETLNYIIGRLKNRDKRVAVTSIGMDGETTDQVTRTSKPEIDLYEDMIFVTSEKHYMERELVAEILNVSDQYTSLGRLVTARVKVPGKIILSGPGSTSWLKSIIREMEAFDVAVTLVDGALSRKSLGSPLVTEGMILTTGAALSHHIPELISKTKFIYSLINLPETRISCSSELSTLENGLWGIDQEGEIHDLQIPSTLLLEQHKERLFSFGNTFFATGVVGDKMLDLLRVQENIKDTVLIVKDFTRIFAGQESVNAYLKKGGRIEVLFKTKLLAVCINPLSPAGYTMNAGKLKERLEERLGIPVYNVKSDIYEDF